MTLEEKKLVIKDICGRLPYKVKIHIGKTQRIEVFDDINLDVGYINNSYADIRPYLFPLSSMTEEQKKEFSLITCDLNDSDYWRDGNMIYVDDKYQLNGIIDFYNKNHLDYRGLIPMGLAIDATNKNIY